MIKLIILLNNFGSRLNSHTAENFPSCLTMLDKSNERGKKMSQTSKSDVK